MFINILLTFFIQSITLLPSKLWCTKNTKLQLTKKNQINFLSMRLIPVMHHIGKFSWIPLNNTKVYQKKLVYSKNLKKVIILELTVSLESNIPTVNNRQDE